MTKKFGQFKMNNTQIDRKLLQNIAHIVAKHSVKAKICEVCGKTTGQLNRHHHNYKKLTDVIILCIPCHAKYIVLILLRKRKKKSKSYFKRYNRKRRRNYLSSSFKKDK